MHRSTLRYFLIALAVAGGLLWLAWQRASSFDLAIGGVITAGANGEREVVVDDAPYLFGMHDPEPAELTPQTSQTFRWSEPQSEILVPHLNAGAMTAQLRIAAPPVSSTTLLLEINKNLLTATLMPEPRTLHIFAPHQPNGSLHVILRNPTYIAPNDPRELGVTLFGMRVQPTTWQAWIPWTAWLQLMGVLLCLGIGAWLAGLSDRVIAGLVIVLGALFALLLATTRTLITTDTARLLAAAGSGFVVVGAGKFLTWLTPRDTAYPLWLDQDAMLVAGLTGLGFAIRLIGIRHPQTNFSDLTLNINNLNAVGSGDVLFTEGLPCEAGAGRAPYPPGFYVLLLPLLLFVPEATKRGIVVQYGGAFLDALIIPMIWWTIRALQPQNRQRAAVWAATLYVIPLPALRSMVVGEWSNVAGQAVGTAAMLGTILWVGHDMPRAWRPAVIASLIVASLMHSGVLLGMALWGVAWIIGLAFQRRWRTIGQLAIVGGVALVFAMLMYFSVFLGDPNLQGNDPACPIYRPLIAKLGGVMTTLLKFDGQLPVWTWFVGVVGAIIARERFSLPLWSWLAVMPLSLGSLISTNQTIRWWTFIMPALCIGGGIGLHRLAQRNRRERWLALAITVLFLAMSLIVWIRFILGYRTGLFVP